QYVGERIWILVGMRGVHVEEPAAVRADGLDRNLRRDGTLRDDLFSALKGMRGNVTVQVLRHTLPDENQADNERYWQEDVEVARCKIDPEVADGRSRAAHKGADECNDYGNARCGRNEIVDGQSCHLREIGERRFAAVVLPIRIGREADG